MANNIQFAFGMGQTDPFDCRPAPVCDPRPVCPACGGLECFCRPRFFAGQLLSEEDLNRLDQYIVGKNRLHNRHLFGTGVVCGLEVVCSTCDPAGSGNVLVRPGYALSPCGNDIVVCKPESVDVCDLINRCRPRAPDCFEPGISDENCQQGSEQWVLAICYRERPSRGITALRGPACGCGASSTGCGCAGTKNAGPSSSYAPEGDCGCGPGTSKKTATTKPATKPGGVPAQCEPTLICEDYTFAVYKLPEKDRERADPGLLVKRFICCFLPLLQGLAKLPERQANKNARQDWLFTLMANVREFLIAEGFYDCDLAARLSAVALPSRGDPEDTYYQKWSTATLSVFSILAAILQKCLCAALLPPCPPPEMNDCVPIATLTVARGQCRVRRICNLGSRRFLLTFPTLQYWLSWLPLLSSWSQPNAKSFTLSDLIDAICCTPIDELFDFRDVEAVDLKPETSAPAPPTPPTPAPPVPVAGAPRTAKAKKMPHPFVELLAESFVGQGQKANAASLLLAAMGAKCADGSPLASEVALQRPAEAMLIHQVLGPALSPLLPLVGAVAPGMDSQKIGEMSAEIAELRGTLKKQQEAIDQLKKR